MTARTPSAAPAAAVRAVTRTGARRAALPATLVAGIALALAALPAAAQDAADPADDEALPDGVLATVNGRPVPALSLENIVRQIEAQGAEPGQEGGPPDRERILRELIDLEILTQEAEKRKLDEQPDIAAALQLQYTQTMANAYLAATGDEMEITDEELRAEYERQTANMVENEYRASHILLESEEDARGVIDELADGAAFETLAEERSTDPTGANGGDLGWFRAGAMIPEFVDAVAAMETGDTSEAPVQSDFGFHVIRLDEKRGAALPDFEAVKPGLTNLVLRDRLAAKVEALREGADIRR